MVDRMEIELDSKKRRFFDDKQKMREKYGIYADYIEPYYLKLCEYAPEARDEMFYKLFNTKMRLGTKGDYCDAYSYRVTQKNRPYNSVRISEENPSDRVGYDEKLHYGSMDFKQVLAEGIRTYLKKLDEADKQFHSIVIEPEIFSADKAARYNKKIQRDAKLKNWLIFEDVNKKFSVLHELNHCLANRKIILLRRRMRPQSYYEALENAMDADIFPVDLLNMAQVYGNSLVSVFNVVQGKPNKVIFESECSRVFEDAIVDDMANALGCELGLSPISLIEFYKTKLDSCYRPFVYLVGMWNLVSDNSLRKNYLTGNSDFDINGTYGFECLFHELLKSCIKENEMGNVAQVEYKEFDYDKIAKNLTSVVQFTDKKYKVQNLTDEQKRLYDFYRTETLNPQVLINYMSEYTDFASDKKEIISKLNQKYMANMRVKQDFCVTPIGDIEKQQSMVM